MFCYRSFKLGNRFGQKSTSLLLLIKMFVWANLKCSKLINLSHWQSLWFHGVLVHVVLPWFLFVWCCGKEAEHHVWHRTRRDEARHGGLCVKAQFQLNYWPVQPESELKLFTLLKMRRPDWWVIGAVRGRQVEKLEAMDSVKDYVLNLEPLTRI